ncbi:NC domain-containing protein [Tanacetum coccineum]
MLDKTPLNTGIYIGTPSKLVIHVTAGGKDISGIFRRKPPKSCSTDGCGTYTGKKSSVFRTCLSCFREGSPVYRYQYGVGTFEHMLKLRGGTCTMAISDPPDEVVRRAHVLLQAGFGKYDLIDNNCEDFGLYCKTSLMVRGGDNKPIIGTSGQGNSWFRASLRSFLMASGAVTLFITPYALDIGGVRDAADRLIIGTSDQWKGIFGTTVASFFAVAGLTFIKLRHDYDIGVRSDAERVPVEEFIELLGRKRSQRMSPIKSET